MALPVNIEKLITGTIVETDRIEFKKGWNPEDVVRTMCAFANDINNLGGGYIIIGIDEEDGNPILPPAGLQKNQIDAYQKKLVELSNRINPAYFGISEPTTIQEKHIFVIYCPGGDNRPYTAPISLSDKREGRAHWIRHYSSTVQANNEQQKKLHELAAKIPFDDRINHQSSLDDLSLKLIKEFLQKVKSPLFEQADNVPFVELCRQMQIVKGPKEDIKPINAGLLLFNESPTDFFPGAKIEVVIYQDEIGDRFSEKIFDGPVHKQLEQALEYLQTNIIREEVAKVQDQAEAERFLNYPYAAIEETLANAVYHRSYQHRGSIEVSVRLDQIEVLSFPGPLPPVDNDMLQKKRIVARDYRNRRIGDFLKELQLTEGRATGFPKIYSAMERNGSPKPRFETNDERTYFLATLPVHNSSKERAQAGAQAEAHAQKNDLNKTEQAILAYLAKGPSSRSSIINQVGSGSRSGHFKRTLSGLLEKELIEYTHPESPRHPNQKYRITDVGKQYAK